MKSKVYVFGLCDVFYDSYYIKGLYELFGTIEYNISKFSGLNQGTFAFIIEDGNNAPKKIIIDSKDSDRVDEFALNWCSVYGKVNYNPANLKFENVNKIRPIGPSFGIRIWNFFEMFYYLVLNFFRFKKSISNKREFIANYWRQYKRFSLKKYENKIASSKNEVFFMNSLWKQEPETNKNRAMFIKVCKDSTKVHFEGGFAARKNGNNFGYENFVYSKRISLGLYLKKNKQSAFVFNTPAVLSCHGWKLAEFLALGKAIISTPHYNRMPADLINGKHVIYVSDPDQLKEAIEKLVSDIDYKKSLEKQSREYFDHYLAPKKVISRLLENV
ncbi:glycosyltransferase [Flavobacterium sp. LC2016-12]|uniref:glycosyltransferase n=1 Tax=Flavobacterium sp. LC2016-12 TaxID=2783794 RepID=UPI00188BF9DA|nr:hypothetical protein [Flavobacterium sp. LC2016-12]MBF4465638.1 hypothetical protein [Flavobacterium sp. LC2016-12]